MGMTRNETLTGNETMTTNTLNQAIMSRLIADAISRSRDHAEIVRVAVNGSQADVAAAMLTATNDDYDYSVSDGWIDAWSNEADHWRIFIQLPGGES